MTIHSRGVAFLLFTTVQRFNLAMKPDDFASANMLADTIFHFDTTLACLICKTHGYAVHPTATAILRHLRGKGHRESGLRLKNILTWCMRLPLSPDPNQLWLQAYSLKPPLHLRVVDGYGCGLCPEEFLTTSLELMQRHWAKYHAQGSQSRIWSSCKLQTLFEETKHRHYRRMCNRGQSLGLHASKDNSSYNEKVTLPCNIDSYHPIAAIAARHVCCVTLSTLDILFKSTSFRTVSHPLFSPGHIDSDNSMLTVFPGSDLDPLFFQALVYALIRVSSEHVVSATQRLYVERTVLHLLRERIEAFPRTRCITIPTIGALLLLKVVSYKLEDNLQHNAHTNGLRAALGVLDRATLPETLQHAIFWQDMNAAILIKSQRTFKDFMDYESFDSLPVQPLPIGFSRVKLHLGQPLCDCIVDTIRFEKARKDILQQKCSSRYKFLNGLQASIESRLEGMSYACRQVSPLAEIVRLATFFWCNRSWMEIWNDPLISCQILRQMLDHLDESLSTANTESLWRNHLDLLYWLLSMVADIVLIEEFRNQWIGPRYYHLLQLAYRLFTKASADEIRTAQNQAKLDFVPDPPWRRH